jgi:hypothetical protein
MRTGRVTNLLLAIADIDGRNLAGQMLTSPRDEGRMTQRKLLSQILACL